MRCYIWFDIYGCIDFMMNHPFPRYSDFLRCFSDLEMNRAGPPPSKLPRLVKFLMEVTVSRPASLLELPGLETISKPLDLTEKDSDCVVLYTNSMVFSPVARRCAEMLRKLTRETKSSTKVRKSAIEVRGTPTLSLWTAPTLCQEPALYPRGRSRPKS